jgi:polyisoprenoid-binding protein YceI
MTGRASRRLWLLLLACSLPAPVRAWTLEIDPAASGVRFTFGATLHTVEGRLAVESGSITLDPATREAAGSVVMDMTSASTGNERRDRKMHEKILQTAAHPKAVFTLERLEGTFNPTGASDLLMHGALDFHGAKHQMLIPARVNVEGDRLTGRCQVTIPYVEWGLMDPSFLLLRVAKTVDVVVEVEGRLQP